MVILDLVKEALQMVRLLAGTRLLRQCSLLLQSKNQHNNII
jgi:hypothetical protein